MATARLSFGSRGCICLVMRRQCFGGDLDYWSPTEAIIHTQSDRFVNLIWFGSSPVCLIVCVSVVDHYLWPTPLPSLCPQAPQGRPKDSFVVGGSPRKCSINMMVCNMMRPTKKCAYNTLLLLATVSRCQFYWFYWCRGALWPIESIGIMTQ